ncbi:MAG TPA: ATP-dependent helicase, partial [Candidatus Binataceae bacterium]|nr:ATP-dependent helicase [Candidatus Binataceae bacterium]
HIKDVLAHLRVVANPTDAVSWLRTLMLVKGIGHRTAARIADEIVAAQDPAAELLKLARGSSQTGITRLAGTLAELRRPGVRPGDQISIAMEYYLPIMREAYADDFPRRERDLEHFQNIASRYRSLESMLAEMALEPPSDSIGGMLAADGEDECVTLSTIHSAKGLEWKTVFIIWAADGRFPGPQSVGEEDLEEERRLMYVASTRARDELYLSYPIYMFDRNFGHVMGRASRFVEDVPPGILHSATLEEAPDTES